MHRTQQQGQADTSKHHYAGRPETIEETAEMVNAAGGVGIPVRVDHTIEAEVAALFKRVRTESRRLDVLVNLDGISGDGLETIFEAVGRKRTRNVRRLDLAARDHMLACSAADDKAAVWIAGRDY